MKKYNFIGYTLALLLLAGACDQELAELEDPEPNTTNVDTTPDCDGATAGTANFSKFIAVGNSFVAGVQGGALFTSGQNNSLPAILHKQLTCVGAQANFNQPSINATLGWNLFVTQPFLADNTKPILGRMLLQYNGAASPRPTPQAYAAGNLEALPNPAANPSFMYGGNKAELHNFAVPAITLGQALTPATGGPPAGNPAFSPFYLRFASAPSADGATGSRIVTDAAASGGTFAFVWLGLDDFLLYAAFGADPAKAPLTDAAAFGGQYGALFAHPAIGLFTLNPNLKAVVGNFPDIFKMPHFTSVPWNAIVFTAADQATKIDPTNGAYAAYNGGLDLAFGGGAITAAERDKRKISFGVGANGIVIEDESLTDLSGLGLPSIRQTTAADVLPLGAGTVLGTEATPGNPASTWGVGKALTDQYVIIPTEKEAINNARTAYNAAVQATVDAFPDKLAMANIDAALNTLITNQAGIYNGITITPNINPPTGIYSEDGVHPNTRGYAFLANVFIDAINGKFGSTIPKVNLAAYKSTSLPIP